MSCRVCGSLGQFLHNIPSAAIIGEVSVGDTNFYNCSHFVSIIGDVSSVLDSAQ